MNRYFNNKGIEYKFNLNKNFDNGAEGKIYMTTHKKIVKIFNNIKNTEKIKKVKAMIELRNSLSYQNKSLLDQLAAWPLCLVFDNNKNIVGYEMEYVEGIPLNSFMSKPILLRHEQYSYYKNAVVANNLANTIAKLHQLLPQVVIGDISKMNIIVLKNHRVKLIDLDSVQLTCNNDFFECEMYTSGYASPERIKDKKTKLSQSSDDFILAIILFELLVNNQHPFALYSKYGDNTTRDNAIMLGKTCYFKKNKNYTPNNTIRPDQILSKELYLDFYQTFVMGYKSYEYHTNADTFRTHIYHYIQDLTVCNKNNEHYHLKNANCPFCNHKIKRLYKISKLSLYKKYISRFN